MSCGALSSMAQDDVYFVPSKASQEPEAKADFKSSYSNVFATEDSNWAAGRGNGGWDVDAYNRRYVAADTASTDTATASSETADTGADYSCTVRLVRFHSPTVGVLVSSPYYYDYYTAVYWADPWFYDPYWGWYGFGWRYGSFYAGFWWGGWYDPWYGPWGPAWGWHHHHHHWAALPPNVHAGPRGGYVAYSNRGTSTRPSTRYFSGRGDASSRYGTGSLDRNYRPSSRYGNTSTDRTFGNVNRQPSRNTSTRPSNTYSPSRSFGSPSGSSVSRPSGNRSFGTGGGASRGGGRSFGGRR